MLRLPTYWSMTRRGRPDGPTGPVTGRALHLLDAFGPQRRELTLSEIAFRDLASAR